MKPVGIHDFSLNCSLGSDGNEIWNNIQNGDISGMTIDTKYLNGDPTFIGKINQSLAKLDAKYSHFDYRANQLLYATFEQIKESYDELIRYVPAHRIGVILGTSTAGGDSLEVAIPFFDKHKKWPKTYLPHHQRMGSVSEFLAEYLGIYGPVMSVSTACSSSVKAMISAQRWINNDICDVVITGGVDVLCQVTVKGFNSLGALSNELCLPFSKNRKGINIGEAAALFILKKETAEINFLGGGESSDAYHISSPDPQGKGAITAMQRALINSGLKSCEVDYLNLHGTATMQNDAMESLAVNAVFDHGICCSSTKALTGHTLGAAGALEIGLSALSMTDINAKGGYIPHIYDDHYDLKLTQLNLMTTDNQLGRPTTIMSNSFAFGGSNASAILSRRK
ncbi:MAG: beta-ketoacyl-ACP synthase [Alcanivoracaceae bacterium]|nr:beta-ketoacyl-ACP synthase [Alcanivoracaceae bacterium]